MTKRNILLVEDHAVIAIAEKTKLETFGYHVFTCSSGEEAIEFALQNKHLNLILMDINLGTGCDGIEAAKVILKNRELPIVFLTSYNDEKYFYKIKEITRYGYVLKESDDLVLRSAIEMAFELFEQYQKTKESEERYRTLFNVLEEGVAINQAIFDDSGEVIDYRILAVNPSFEKHSPYCQHEVIGKLASEAYAMSPELIKQWWNVHVHKKEASQTEYFHQPTDMWFHIITTLPKDGNFATIFTNITEKKKGDEKIRRLLKEKEILLTEIHHRIKNNLNTIVGLLTFQSQKATTKDSVQILNDAIIKIKSMDVLYNKLFQQQNYQEASIKEYLEQLVQEITNLIPHKDALKIELYIDDFLLDEKTLFPVGIIFNELLTNTIKHGMRKQKQVIFKVFVKKSTYSIHLRFEDNGKGMNINAVKNGLGLTLVQALAEQLKASLTIASHEGTQISLDMKITEPANQAY